MANQALEAKRTWVDLSDDEIYEIHTKLINEIYANPKTFAYVFESKLKDAVLITKAKLKDKNS